MNRMRALAASPRQIATIWRCATGSVPTRRIERQVGIEPGERRLRRLAHLPVAAAA